MQMFVNVDINSCNNHNHCNIILKLKAKYFIAYYYVSLSKIQYGRLGYPRQIQINVRM